MGSRLRFGPHNLVGSEGPVVALSCRSLYFGYPRAHEDDAERAVRAGLRLIDASVMKDGWSYALDAANGSCRWQFPATVPPGADCKFAPAGAHVHGDTDYKRPGAAWGDVLAITTGGEALVTSTGVFAGYGRLHAL